MPKYVLLTGFEAFGGERINPSEVVVRSLDGRAIAGRRMVARILPVRTNSVVAQLNEAVSETCPELTVCLGQALGRRAVALERLAANTLDFNRPDNAGIVLKDLPVVPGGPATRPATLPLENILAAWSKNGVPGYISESAGAYVCNQVFYALQTLADGSPMVSGFVHLPALPEQAVSAGPETMPSMSFDLMKRAIELLIETTLSWMDSKSNDAGLQPSKGRLF